MLKHLTNVTLVALLVLLSGHTGKARSGVVALPQTSPSQSSVGGTTSRPPSASQATFQKYCVTCHNDRLKTGGLSIQGLDPSDPSSHPDIWEKVVRRLRTRSMPPSGLPRPENLEYESLAGELESRLDAAAQASPYPGRTETLHRLSRTEYQNAIRDLLALDIDATELLPPDDSGYGFDNIAGVLGLSPAQVERYIAAARKISRLTIGDAPTAPIIQTFRLQSDSAQAERLADGPFGTRGGGAFLYNFPADGEYHLAIDVSPTPEPSTVEVLLDGARVSTMKHGGPRPNVKAGEAKGESLPLTLQVKAGPQTLMVTFVKRTNAQDEALLMPFKRPAEGAAGYFGQGPEPRLEGVSISGPYPGTAPASVENTPSRRRVFMCKPSSAISTDACANRILTNLAQLAFRRPVAESDMVPLVAFYKDGAKQGGFEGGIEAGVRYLLASPDFLFRVERDPASTKAAGVYQISDVELASRLSFFLWSSVPDQELLDSAMHGRLRNQAEFARQVRRMLRDPKADSLATNFGEQWLGLRKVFAQLPDRKIFPDFDGALRDYFLRETDLFLESIIREDHSVVDLLNANYTYLNGPLAAHYGIPDVYGERFRKVTLPADGPRGGLLGQASVLLVTSYANRTSPVIRGKWILQNVLGTPPPPPPPNVPALPENTGAGGQTLSMRERMVAHRSNPACAGCHKLMDPLGLSLEHFDAVGRWRRTDDGAKIDASGALPDGITTFNDASGLREALVTRSPQFVMTVTEKLMTYALGRGTEYDDAPALRKIVRDAAPSHYKISALILGIVSSVPFQERATTTRVNATTAVAQQ